jgi:hypothetical protein
LVAAELAAPDFPILPSLHLRVFSFIALHSKGGITITRGGVLMLDNRRAGKLFMLIFLSTKRFVFLFVRPN